MDQIIQPFWKEAYKNDSLTAFSMSPNATVKEFESLFHKKWNILESGCGEGQNVISGKTGISKY